MFEIKHSVLGKVKLSDNSELSIRVAIVNVKESGMSPVGPDFLISAITRVSVSFCPDEIKGLVRDKPVLPSDAIKRPEEWEIIDIVDASKACEECIYKACDGRRYLIRVEVKPTIVARTLKYRDDFGNPIYYVRWARRDIVELQRG